MSEWGSDRAKRHSGGIKHRLTRTRTWDILSHHSQLFVKTFYNPYNIVVVLLCHQPLGTTCNAYGFMLGTVGSKNHVIKDLNDKAAPNIQVSLSDLVRNYLTTHCARHSGPLTLLQFSPNSEVIYLPHSHTLSTQMLQTSGHW